LLRQVNGASISSSVGGDAKGTKRLMIVGEGAQLSRAAPARVRAIAGYPVNSREEHPVDVALADGAVEKIADPDSSLVVGRRVYYPSRGYGVVDKVDSGAAKPFRVVFEDGGESRQARPPTPATNGLASLGDWCVRACCAVLARESACRSRRHKAL
jgi:hypothetical protein